MNFRKLVLGVLISLSTSAYATVNLQTDYTTLKELKSMSENDVEEMLDLNDVKNIRLKSMRDKALAVGAQNGYVERMNELKTIINDRANSLDRLFDFNVVMKLASKETDELYLLPPVVSIQNDVIALSDDASHIKRTKTLTQIIKPSRLTTAAPNWRQYLLFDQPIEIEKPPKMLLPKDNQEKKLWAEWVEKGWVAGVYQAESEVAYRANRLGEDFNGMLKYMRLVSNNKMLKPVVVSSQMDVLGDANTLREHEEIIKLAIPAEMNLDNNSWEVLMMDSRNTLREPIELHIEE